jgi:glycosyltransferase involved in cell wall biosynthesis
VSDANVSVIVPARNAERHLREALCSALEQDPPPLEVIVVDDGSTDATAALAESLGQPVRVLRQPPAGIGAARNRGVSAARGEIVGFLDADDRWAPGALAARLRGFQSSGAPDLVWGRVRHFISPDLDSQAAAGLYCPPDAAVAHLAGGLLVRRAALEQVGPFATDVRVGEFIDWVLRSREAGLAEALVDDVVLWRRVHPGSHTARNRDALSDVAHVLKASLDRRRAQRSVGA